MRVLLLLHFSYPLALGTWVLLFVKTLMPLLFSKSCEGSNTNCFYFFFFESNSTFV
uniref:Uncharacterized protein n=1 Tax=Arundo donax TaxID=35708 RepID=A0A0A9GYR0_ARUDO